MISKASIEADLRYYKDLRTIFANRGRRGKQLTLHVKWQHNKKRLYVYDQVDQSDTYISKKDLAKLITVLTAKMYEEYLEQIDLNISILEFMLENYLCLAGYEEFEVRDRFMNRMKENLSGTFADGHEAIAIPDPIDHSINVPVRYNPYHTERLIHKTPAGVLMRSREEAAIGTYLESLGIEYEYDVEIWANGNRYYVDFLVRRRSDGAYVIWEHYGVRDVESYDEKTFRKHYDYNAAGYRLGDNYICTYEDENGGLDMVTIAKLVKLTILCE